MKKKVLAGLIVIAAIVLVAMFAGCVEVEEAAPLPSPTPTSTTTPKSTTTPTSTTTLDFYNYTNFYNHTKSAHIPSSTPTPNFYTYTIFYKCGKSASILTSITTPTSTPTFQELIDAELKELPTGKILFNPPTEMKVGDTELVVVRITQNISEDLTKGLKGKGDPLINETKISTYMKVRLTGMNFDIDPHNGAAKIIESNKYTEWRFHVTPLKSGIQTLHLTYYVILSIPGHDDKNYEYEVGDWEINVIITPLWFLKCNLEFIVATLLAIVGLIIAVIAIRKKR